MRKIFFTLLILFILYFAVQGIFYYWGPGHSITYTIDEYEIKETYTNNQANELKSYDLVFTKNNKSFEIQTFDEFNNEKEIVESIKEYSGASLNCILPVFKEGKILTHIICLKDNILYNYETLIGENEELDRFYESLKGKFEQENLEHKSSKSQIDLYTNNVLPNYYISFVTDKGFINITPSTKEIAFRQMFNKTVESYFLSDYVDKYFVTVDYDNAYNYNAVEIYNLITLKSETIKFPKELDKDSYVEGIQNNSLFIYDRVNRKQYEVNVEAKAITEVGNANEGIKVLKDGKFQKINAYDASNENIVFSNEDQIDSEGYYFLDKIGNLKTGYTYYYKKTGEEYEVYRTNNSNTKAKMFLFKTNSIKQVKIINEYVFYIDDQSIKYYSDSTGIRTLLLNRGPSFNELTKYQIIYQK